MVATLAFVLLLVVVLGVVQAEVVGEQFAVDTVLVGVGWVTAGARALASPDGTSAEVPDAHTLGVRDRRADVDAYQGGGLPLEEWINAKPCSEVKMVEL